MQDFKRRPLHEVSSRAHEIWQEFLAEGAPSSINLDSHSYERTSQNLKDPGRYSYEDAQVSCALYSPRMDSRGFARALLLVMLMRLISNWSEWTRIYFEFTRVYSPLHLCWQHTSSFTSPLIHLPVGAQNPPYSCYTREWMRGQGRIRRKTGREEWQSVFVPGANEASNSMNRWFSRFTVDSTGFKVRWWCVTCNASHWQDITQLCLEGLCCSCQYARVCVTPANHIQYACTVVPWSGLSLIFHHICSSLAHRPQNTHLCGFLYLAGAHIQANEKWQLCTLFAVQHLPRPPVGQKEGELHSLTPVSPLHLTWRARSFCVLHIWLICCFFLMI